MEDSPIHWRGSWQRSRGLTCSRSDPAPAGTPNALDEAGLCVRRTDITQAFIDLQQERGKVVDRLDVTVDDLAGPYDGIVCLAVLQHVPKDQLPGEGERWEIGDSGNPYYSALWDEAEFVDLLAEVGLTVDWRDSSSDSEDSDWLWILAHT
ncbi:MAG: hypothetical protein ABIR39_00460 [Nocardioides sp.]|uniref:hypothetical protein n=1 Tax=Nocardioides sp. TaxID=35761 RepID=UPI0032677BBC